MSPLTIDQPTKGLIPAYRHIQDLRRLIHLEAAKNYTLIYLQDRANPLLVSKTLKYFEQQLPSFIRLSKAILINPRFVSKVIKQGSKLLLVELSTGARFSVSRRRIDQVFLLLAKPT